MDDGDDRAGPAPFPMSIGLEDGRLVSRDFEFDFDVLAPKHEVQVGVPGCSQDGAMAFSVDYAPGLQEFADAGEQAGFEHGDEMCFLRP